MGETTQNIRPDYDGRLGRDDRAGFPASGTLFLSFCLPLFWVGHRRSVEISERRFSRLSFSFNAPRAIARDVPRIGDGRIFVGAGISTLRHADCIFRSWAITFDFQSSSDGAQRRRLSYPPRQGPRSWWRGR